MNKFLAELKRILTEFCNRPDHLQRWAIIGVGLVMYPTIWAVIWIIRWSFGSDPTLYPQIITILGNALYGFLALFGLVVIALLGIIRGVKAVLPNGTSVEVDLMDKMDGTASTVNVTTVTS